MEIRELAEEMAEEQENWLGTCSPHVKYLYSRVPTGPPLVPLLRELLGVIHLPAKEDLCQDLTHGFEVLEGLNSSPWWEFAKPERVPPLTLQEFHEANQEEFKDLRLIRPPGQARRQTPGGVGDGGPEWQGAGPIGPPGDVAGFPDGR